MDEELKNKLTYYKESLKTFQEVLKNHSFFYRGYFIGLFVYVEQLMDCLIAANICDSVEGERSDLAIAIMDFINADKENIRSMVFFLARADKLKQQGFYIDYDNAIKPQKKEVALLTYEGAYKTIFSIKKIVMSYITELESMSEKNREVFINKLTSNNGFYENFRWIIKVSEDIKKKKI